LRFAWVVAGLLLWFGLVERETRGRGRKGRIKKHQK
jgi:hypothetical protein